MTQTSVAVAPGRADQAAAARPARLPWAHRGAAVRFLAGAGLSLYGDSLTTVAVVVMLLRLTGSPGAPAAYMLARVASRAVGATPGGWLADRFSPSLVVAGCSVAQGLATVSIIASARAHSALGIYAAVVVSCLLGGASRSALGAIPPRVVDRSSLARVNGLYSLTVATSLLIAPALAAPVLVVWGAEPLLAADAATFVVAALLYLSLPASAPGGPRQGSLFRGAAAGLSLVANDPRLRALATVFFAEAMVATAAGSVLVVAAAQRLGGDDHVGYLYAAVGAGSTLACIVLLARRNVVLSRLQTIAFGLTAIVAVAVFSIAPSLWAAVVPLAVTGGAGTLYQTWGTIDLQRRVEVGVLGRVNAAVVLSAFMGMLAGALLAVWLVPALRWDRALFAICCLGVLVLAVAAFAPGRAHAVDLEPRTASPHA